MINLIPRFYDVSEGLTIDGKNLKSLYIDELRSLISLVSQDAILFNTSIIENIAFGKSNQILIGLLKLPKTPMHMTLFHLFRMGILPLLESAGINCLVVKNNV